MPDETATVKPAQHLATRATQAAAKAVAAQPQPYADNPDSWARADNIVRKHIISHYEAGVALVAMQKFKLYKYSNTRGITASTKFEDAVRTIYDVSRSRAYQLIDHALVTDRMYAAHVIDLPETAYRVSTIVDRPPPAISTTDTSNSVAGGNQVASVADTTTNQTTVANKVGAPATRKLPGPTENQSRYLKNVPVERLEAVWALSWEVSDGKPPGEHHIRHAIYRVCQSETAPTTPLPATSTPTSTPEPVSHDTTPAPSKLQPVSATSTISGVAATPDITHASAPTKPQPVSATSAGTHASAPIRPQAKPPHQTRTTLVNAAQAAIDKLNITETTSLVCQAIADKPLKNTEILKAILLYATDSDKPAIINQICTLLGELPTDVLQAHGFTKIQTTTTHPTQ